MSVLQRKKLSPHRIYNSEVANVFKTYPKSAKPHMKQVRSLIIKTAEKIEYVGPLEEVLKWGEPSYLTSLTKSGSTVRIDWKDKNPDYAAIYFKCTTDLVALFRKKFKGIFQFSDNRAIFIPLDEDIPEQELQLCIAMALTYHLNKKLPTRSRWKLVEDLLV